MLQRMWLGTVFFKNLITDVMTSRISKADVTFRFKNIGPVRKADLELGDLTVIAGRNNTGKTYIAYTLYGFLKWESSRYDNEFLATQKFSRAQFLDIHQMTEKISREGLMTFPLDTETFLRQRREMLKVLSRTFSRDILHSVFSSQKDDFTKTSVDVDIGQACFNHYQYPESNLDYKKPLSIKYDGSKVTITCDREKFGVGTARLQNLISHNYFRFLLHDLFPDPFILSAERFGISLFYRELDFTKNQIVDILQKMGADVKDRKRKLLPFMLLEKSASRNGQSRAYR